MSNQPSVQRRGPPDSEDEGPHPVAQDVLELEHEIARRQRAEALLGEMVEELATASSGWRASLDALEDLLVVVLDRQGRVQRANRTVESWSGAAVQEVAGHRIHALLHPLCEDRECYLETLWRRSAESSSEFEVEECEVDDLFLGRRVLATLRRLGNMGAGDGHALLVLRDMTEAHRRTRRLLGRSRFQAYEQMVRGLAHEIGNPLAILKTSIQVLRRNFDRFDQAKKDTYLNWILEATGRIETLVEELVESQQSPLGESEALPLERLLDRAEGLFADHRRRRGVELRILPHPPGIAVAGDEVSAEVALDCVLDNAIEACADGGRVEVRSALEGQRVLIQVSDSGPGIPPEDLEKVFHPFFTTKPRSLGIGLTHAEQLMRRMGGFIELENPRGGGTLCTLTFTRHAAKSVGGENSRLREKQ